MAGAQPSLAHISAAPAHTGAERCPWCDQAIPHEKFAEVQQQDRGEGARAVRRTGAVAEG